MCIIVDTNKLGTFFADQPDEDSKPIHDWLKGGKGRIVYSTQGGFKQEIRGKAKDKLREYVRKGMAEFIPSSQFDHAVCDLKARVDLRSNDQHVLALAMEAGVRLLYTADKNLIFDFKKLTKTCRPRGKVYSSKSNANLLTDSVCAPKARR